ncbi:MULTISPECIES: hypothetical protein [Cyanophyceae]|uniref:hypothetical protein n=1 Tax=Cyanophyceae TaxID=3028117 RepID=UPI00168852E1|nr:MULTISPECIES: hypothetical protein [Cyanophyceae]MBD1917449.1 hypothetical protein [Phormidium sp. FACHB-77]MBD2032306.1 hypothetical protein [Phormidium sp. FACHB-322]MBD2052244.1 hypothetical protein [Leptolyngbya sp. FACHB-60]
MVYVAYWKKRTEVIWNKITSPNPITWTQQIIPAVAPVYPFTGGQCPPPATYQITYEIRSRTSTFFGCGAWGAWALRNNIIPNTIYYGPIGVPTLVITNSTTPSNNDKSAGWSVTYNNSSGVRQTGWLSLGGATTRNYASGCGLSYEYRNFKVTRSDGKLDSCGDPAPTTPGSSEKCKTTFSTGLIVEDATCIEVTNKQPGCGCCSVLMPKATRILGML